MLSHQRWVVIDFETRSICDLKRAGAYRYAEDPTTEILCMSWCNEKNERGTWFPGQPPQTSIIEDRMVVCHNAAFERNIWRSLMEPLGWPPIPISQWHDTMARGCQLALPASLDGVLRAMRLTEEKDKEGSRYTVGLSRPRKDGSWQEPDLERVGRYCESDVRNQTALHKRIGWLSPHERPIFEESCEINDRGFRLDMDFVRAAQKIVDEASKPLAAEFKAITGFSVNQVGKVKQWVIDQGVPIENLAKDTIAALLKESDEAEEGDGAGSENGEIEEADLPELPAIVHRALSIRQLIGSSSIKKLKAMPLCVSLDGRARGTLRYHGTTPGRQTGQLLQPHNFPRGTVKHDPLEVIAAIKTGDWQYVEALYGPAVEVVASSLRHAIVADRGKELFSGDYSGIQARTVLALAGQHDKTALMASGADVYCDMASNIYRRPITKADAAERQVGKNSVLGLGFQMGWKKFFDMYCAEQTPEFAQAVVDVYRKEWAPLVPKTWYGLQEAAVRTVWDRTAHSDHGVTFRLEDVWLTAHIQGTPDDCKLWYLNPQRVTTEEPWSTDEEPDYRRGFTYQVQKNGHLITRHAFGGQLTENVVMKIEREIMEDAKKRLKAQGFPVILEAHDELVAEVPEGADLTAYARVLEDVASWTRALQIPIAVETWQGPVYKK